MDPGYRRPGTRAVRPNGAADRSRSVDPLDAAGPYGGGACDWGTRYAFDATGLSHTEPIRDSAASRSHVPAIAPPDPYASTAQREVGHRYLGRRTEFLVGWKGEFYG